MAITFRKHGTKQAVLKVIADLKEIGPDGKTIAEDQRQAESVKTFIAAEIASLPDNVAALEVIVDAQAHSGIRQSNIIIKPYNDFHV